MSLTVFGSGFFIGFSLITAIGAQNAHILRQGIAGQQIFPCVIVCTLCDTILMSAGIFGFGAAIELWPSLGVITRLGGALFLVVYGFFCFKNARRSAALDIDGRVIYRMWPALATTFAVTLLNPHVYLDTIIFIGSIGAQYGKENTTLFALGAVSASWVWFFVLGYGAVFLRPYFESPRAWQILDLFIGCMMWGIAISLVVTPL